jgi:hypothetical protein
MSPKILVPQLNPNHPIPPIAPATQVITEMLPPELKAFAGVQLPKIKMGGVIPQIKLPPLPANLPPLADILRALPPIDAAGLNAALPGLSLLNLPPPAEIVKALHTVGGLLATLPKPEGLPSLDEIIRIVNSFSGTVNKVVSAPGTEQPVIG